MLSAVVFAGCLLSADAANAAPSNGVTFPPKCKAEIGYEYNLMYKRPLADSYGNIKTQDNFFVASVGIFDWLVLDGKIGMGDMDCKGGIHLPKLEFNSGFAGGYGFRIKAYENRDWGFRAVCGFQHISVHPQDRSADNDKYETFLDDWQVSALLAQTFKFLTAYVGIKGSDCEMVYKINKHDKKRRYSQNHIGLMTGADFRFLNDRLRAGFEARFFDETGFSTSIGYIF